jgi:magnesium-transporting ATPase (P-type)
MFPENVMLSSTVVSSGQGECVVFAIGMDTKVGQMASELTKDRGVLFPLRSSLNKFTAIALIIAAVYVTGLLIYTIVSGYQEPVNRQNTTFGRVLMCILVSVQAAVFILPTGIMPVLLMILQRSLVSLKNKNAKVKKASCVDVLGCVTVVCSDKTGTFF